MKLYRVIRDRRCPLCGDWVTATTMAHSSFAALASGASFCIGKGAGRERVRVFACEPTEKDQRIIARHFAGHPEHCPYLHWRKATPAERREALTNEED